MKKKNSSGGKLEQCLNFAIFDHILLEGIDCGIHCACRQPWETTAFGLTEL